MVGAQRPWTGPARVSLPVFVFKEVQGGGLIFVTELVVYLPFKKVPAHGSDSIYRHCVLYRWSEGFREVALWAVNWRRASG